MAPGAAQVVDQLVARDRMGPGGDRAPRIVGVSGEMQGEQSLLQHVLGLARFVAPGAGQHLPEIAAQPETDRVEEAPIGSRIAVERGEENGPELCFEVFERQGLSASRIGLGRLIPSHGGFRPTSAGPRDGVAGGIALTSP